MLHRKLRHLLAGVTLVAALGFPTARAKTLPARHSIDLNSATLDQLEQLPGVGNVRAQSILDYRQKSGGFRSINDLLVIHGFSRKEVEKLRPYAVVGPMYHTPPPKNPSAATPHTNAPAPKSPAANTASPPNNLSYESLGVSRLYR
jgi:competence ComEA-like helix-hairpin-helix protein